LYTYTPSVYTCPYTYLDPVVGVGVVKDGLDEIKVLLDAPPSCAKLIRIDGAHGRIGVGGCKTSDTRIIISIIIIIIIIIIYISISRRLESTPTLIEVYLWTRQ
jgi:hypothetical protein